MCLLEVISFQILSQVTHAKNNHQVMFFFHDTELCIFSGHWRWAAGECSLKTSLGCGVPRASTLCRVECEEQPWILPKICPLMPCLQKCVAHTLEQIASTYSPWQHRHLSTPVNSHADLRHPAKEQTCMPTLGYQQDFSMGGEGMATW